MPKFDIETIEKWEKRVKYHDIEADTLLDAYQEIVNGEHSYDQHETLESGDEVLFCCEAFDSETTEQISVPPEIGYSAYAAKPDPPAFNDRELATVLAALRIFQQDPAVHAYNVPDHFLEFTPLTADEIDALCERINVTV